MQMYNGHYQEISYVHEEPRGWDPKNSPWAVVRWSDLKPKFMQAKLRPKWSDLTCKCKLSKFEKVRHARGAYPRDPFLYNYSPSQWGCRKRSA